MDNYQVINSSEVVLPDVNVGPHRKYKAAEKTLHFVNVSNTRGSCLLFKSPEFVSVKGPVGEVIGYPFTQDVMSPFPVDYLEFNVKSMESVIEGNLGQFLRIATTPDLNPTLRELYLSKPKLRPTFRNFNETEGIYWAKLTVNTLYYNWHGAAINPSELGPGRYQFLLRCNGVYMGQHGDSSYVASLNLRVVQVRFEPMDLMRGMTLPTTCLLNDDNTPPNTPTAGDSVIPFTLQRQNAISMDASTPKKGRKKRASTIPMKLLFPQNE
jgi:hypothetical protein